MKYLIRSIKYFLYFVILCGIIVTIVFTFSTKPEGTTIMDLFGGGAGYKMLAFFVAFSAIYPLLGFSKKEIYVSNFAENKNEIIDLFKNANFVITQQTPYRIIFRPKNKFLRITRMCEDSITVDFSENPVIIDGLRKDVIRFARGIEYICQKAEEQ